MTKSGDGEHVGRLAGLDQGHLPGGDSAQEEGEDILLAYLGCWVAGLGDLSGSEGLLSSGSLAEPGTSQTQYLSCKMW